MKRTVEETNRVRQLIQQNLQRKIANFEVQPMKCPDCGHQEFDRSVRYFVGFVPEVVCQQPGGQYVKNGMECYKCLGCGREYRPEEWQEMARKVFEEDKVKVIAPADMKPDDNGKE